MKKKIIDFLDAIVYGRPIPNRDYDQIYMNASSMLRQIKFIKKFISHRKMVFLGDGDGMSILLSALSENGELEKIDSITVYDFDERILNSIRNQINQLNVITTPFTYKLYNVIMPIEKEEQGKYDFFYINPPYGSKNSGFSCILWIDRCIDLCINQCLGCIIIPYDQYIDWTVNNMIVIQKYLIEKGFIIKEMKEGLHQYHLDDNPNLTSVALIVEKRANQASTYHDKFIEKELVKNLYGSPRRIPKYIYISNEDLSGRKDFSWEYGEDNFWI